MSGLFIRLKSALVWPFLVITTRVCGLYRLRKSCAIVFYADVTDVDRLTLRVLRVDSA